MDNKGQVETHLPDHDEIMTLTEIAGYLKVSEKTVLRMVRSKQFPGVKISGQWRFVRTGVDDWLSSKMYAAPKKSLLSVVGPDAHGIPLTRLVSSQRILLDVKPGGREHILRQLVSPLKKADLVSDADRYVASLLAREDVVSTGIGHGLALPHVREPHEIAVAVPCIVLGICREGTDFGALDGNPTYVFAMPCSASEADHLRLLAKISLCFRRRGSIGKMAATRTKKEILTMLAAMDRDLMSVAYAQSRKLTKNHQQVATQ